MESISHLNEAATRVANHYAVSGEKIIAAAMNALTGKKPLFNLFRRLKYYVGGEEPEALADSTLPVAVALAGLVEELQIEAEVPVGRDLQNRWKWYWTSCESEPLKPPSLSLYQAASLASGHTARITGDSEVDTILRIGYYRQIVNGEGWFAISSNELPEKFGAWKGTPSQALKRAEAMKLAKMLDAKAIPGEQSRRYRLCLDRPEFKEFLKNTRLHDETYTS